MESYEIKGVDAIAPEFILDEASLTLTIRCQTEGAEIYYGIGENVEPTIRYQSPITLTDNRPVRAMAKKEGYNNSKVSTFDLKWSDWTCPKPTFRLSGAKLYIESTMENVIIYYTMDGETPTTSSLQYTQGEPLEITFNCTVKAIVIKKGYRDSGVLFPIQSSSPP